MIQRTAGAALAATLACAAGPATAQQTPSRYAALFEKGRTWSFATTHTTVHHAEGMKGKRDVTRGRAACTVARVLAAGATRAAAVVCKGAAPLVTGGVFLADGAAVYRTAEDFPASAMALQALLRLPDGMAAASRTETVDLGLPDPVTAKVTTTPRSFRPAKGAAVPGVCITRRIAGPDELVETYCFANGVGLFHQRVENHGGTSRIVEMALQR